MRSGYPREEMAELHGNCFAERCELCETEYVRDFEMPSVGFKTTGRRCGRAGVRRRLGVAAVVSATRCSTGRTLTSRGIETRGTRIQGGCARARPRVESADHAELRLAPQDDEETTRRFRSRTAIVNLQMTPKDRHATLVVHAKVDRVMGLDATARRGGARVRAPRRVDRLARERNASGSGGAEFESEWTARTDGDVPCRGWRPRAWNFAVSWTRTGGSSRREDQTCDGVGEGRRGFRWKRR